MNGTSTVEVEACCIQKPLFIIQTKCNGCLDPFDTKSSGAAIDIIDVCELEHCLVSYFETGSHHYPEKQDAPPSRPPPRGFCPKRLPGFDPIE